jgi:hypothetical protein
MENIPLTERELDAPYTITVKKNAVSDEEIEAHWARIELKITHTPLLRNFGQ